MGDTHTLLGIFPPSLVFTPVPCLQFLCESWQEWNEKDMLTFHWMAISVFRWDAICGWPCLSFDLKAFLSAVQEPSTKNKPTFVYKTRLWAALCSCVFLNTHSFLSWRFIYIKNSIKAWFMFTNTSEPTEIFCNSFTHSLSLLFIYSALLILLSDSASVILSVPVLLYGLFLICLLNFIVKCFVMLSRELL